MENYFKDDEILSLEETQKTEQEVLDSNDEIISETAQEFLSKAVKNTLRSKEFVEVCLNKGVPKKDMLSLVSSTYYEEYMG